MNKGIKLLFVLCFQLSWVNYSFALQNGNGLFKKQDQLPKSTWYPMVITTKYCPYFPSLIKIGASCLTESNCDGFVICGSYCFFLNSLGNNLNNGIITTYNCDANLVYLLLLIK